MTETSSAVVGVPGQRGAAASADEVAERLLGAALGAADLLSVHLGDRLGWYDALAGGGPATAPELAERTGTSARYAREWLEQQATTGLLELVADGPPDVRRYRLPPGAAEVLTDRGSLSYLAPLARMIAAAATQLPALVGAYRTGGGVAWAQFGADMRESQADMNRPWFERELGGALAGVPSLHAALARPGAVVADIGCGSAWSTVALARAYPDARVEAWDVDPPSVDLARGNVAAAGLADRVVCRLGDAAQLPEGRYDVVLAFECVHDLPRPVEVLAAARRSLAPGGQLVVMDEAVADRLTVPGDEVERLMYGFSLLVCLPDGMAHPPSAGTGTVLRPDVLRGYARRAGFADVEVLPVEGFGPWRFYRLTG